MIKKIIKRILILLLILIILIAGGIIALVVFVNPNNFKGFISEAVKSKTGYELTIDGDLQWHIWPQISILSGPVRLEDEGAKAPVLMADNMRLDVELFPLFSKELVVKNVFIKSTVINVTDESKGKVIQNRSQTAVVNQSTTTRSLNSHNSGSKWSLSLNQLDIEDSTIILQSGQDLIRFRNISLILKQNNHHISVNLNGGINRNQTDFVYSIDSDVDLTNFPENVTVTLNNVTYHYNDVNAQEIKGALKGTFNYQHSPLTINSDDLVFTLNGNQIDGKLKASIDTKPYFEATLKANSFDLSSLLPQNKENAQQNNQLEQSKPVVQKPLVEKNELAFLRHFDAKFYLSVDELKTNDLIINQFVIDADNKNGIASLNQIDFDIADGHITANGTANGKSAKTHVAVATNMKNIDLGKLFTQLNWTQYFKGIFSAQGHIATETIASERIIAALTGNLAVNINHARFENINIKRIIQTTINQYSKNMITTQEQQKYTEVQELAANVTLGKGIAQLSTLNASSATISVKGDGVIGIIDRNLDLNLKVKMLEGWNSKSKNIAKLQKIEIPLRIYGLFSELHYTLNIDKAVKDIIDGVFKESLDKVKDILKNMHENSEASSSTDVSDEQKKEQSRSSSLRSLLRRVKDDD